MITLGIVLPMGQSKELLLRSGQWNLWEKEIAMYKKSFGRIEVFEYQYHGLGRFFEALLMPIREKKRWISCDAMKAVHLTGSVPCLIGRLAYGIPYLLSYGYRYDQFAKIDNKGAQWVLIKFLTPIAIKYASAVMVPTRELRDYVQSMEARKIVIIPNGVDTNIFKGPTLRIQGRTLRVLFVGRLEKQKNLEVLIKVVHSISKGLTLSTQGQTFKDICLVFIGNGSLKDRLLAVAKKLDVDLEIQEPIPNDQLPRIYQQADIFILPSLIEGHPKALLEAMSSGLPCLASDISGVNEILVNGKNGLLVKPTVASIAQGLQKLIEDNDLQRRIGMEARKTIETTFDKNSLMNREIELLQALKEPSVRRYGGFLKD